MLQTNSSFLFEPGLPIDSLDTAPIFEIQAVHWFHRIFFVPNFLCPCQLQPHIIFCELHILLEQPIQLSVQVRHEDFFFRTEFAHLPDLDLAIVGVTTRLSRMKMTLAIHKFVANFDIAIGVATVTSFSKEKKMIVLFDQNRIPVRDRVGFPRLLHE